MLNFFKKYLFVNICILTKIQKNIRLNCINVLIGVFNFLIIIFKNILSNTFNFFVIKYKCILDFVKAFSIPKIFRYEYVIAVCGLKMEWKTRKQGPDDWFGKIDPNYTIADLWAPFGNVRTGDDKDTLSMVEYWSKPEHLKVIQKLKTDFDVSYTEILTSFVDYIFYKIQYFVYFPYNYWKEVYIVFSEPLIQAGVISFVLHIIFIDYEEVTIGGLSAWYKSKKWLYRQPKKSFIKFIERWGEKLYNRLTSVPVSTSKVLVPVPKESLDELIKNRKHEKSNLDKQIDEFKTVIKEVNLKKHNFAFGLGLPNTQCTVFDDRLCIRETCCKVVGMEQLMLMYANKKKTSKEPFIYLNAKSRLSMYCAFLIHSKTGFKNIFVPLKLIPHTSYTENLNLLNDKSKKHTLKPSLPQFHLTRFPMLQEETLYVEQEYTYRINLSEAYSLLILSPSSILNPRYVVDKKALISAECIVLDLDQVHRNMTLFYNVFILDNFFWIRDFKQRIAFKFWYDSDNIRDDIYNIKKRAAALAGLHHDDPAFYTSTRSVFFEDMLCRLRMYLIRKTAVEYHTTCELFLDSYSTRGMLAYLSSTKCLHTNFSYEYFHGRSTFVQGLIFARTKRYFPHAAISQMLVNYHVDFSKIATECNLFHNITKISNTRRMLFGTKSEFKVKKLTWNSRLIQAKYINDGKNETLGVLWRLLKIWKPIINGVKRKTKSEFMLLDTDKKIVPNYNPLLENRPVKWFIAKLVKWAGYLGKKVGRTETWIIKTSMTVKRKLDIFIWWLRYGEVK